MATDEERREVAAKLRHSWANVPDKDPVRHQLRVLFEIYSAVGLADDDDADAIDLFDRLVDLIEPGEQKVRCVAEVKVDGERLEKLAHDAAVELTGIDRDALLELADEMDEVAQRRRSMGYEGFAIGDEDRARRIREALGVSDDA